MTTPAPLLRLQCSVNSYPWGKKGSDSLSARLAQHTPGFALEEGKEYAGILQSPILLMPEMWMGTYPTLPAKVLATGEELQAVLDAHPKLVGKKPQHEFGHKLLPFLPKILSVAKALPLQIHPNKEVAGKLHKENPDQFGDPNHKPEIAIALGEFEAFCGWKPLSDIAELLAKLPPLQKYHESSGSFGHDELEQLVSKILRDSDDGIKTVQAELLQLPESAFGAKGSYIPGLLPRLQEQYSATDPGNLVAVILMNYLNLQKGEAIYVPADGIHAYLSGDLYECMARSDNVINDGFMPREDRDNVDLFLQTMGREPSSKEKCLLPVAKVAGLRHTTAYRPPLSEFNVLRTELPAGQAETIPAGAGGGILIVLGGAATLRAGGTQEDAREGYIYFVGAETALEIEASSEFESYLARFE